MIWRGFVILALLAVATVSLFTSRRQPDSGQSAAATEPPQPGYYMSKARIVETDRNGAPLYTVTAQRIQQDPADLSIRLDDLKLLYSAADARGWTLTAASGFVPPGSKDIDLTGNVRVVGQPEPQALTAVLRTERLRVDTENHVATTKERVDIDWGGRRLSSIGLKADLKAERLQLESAVHGRFAQ